MSNDAALIAAELQDLASSVDEVASALRERETSPSTSVVVNVPEQPAPQVVVNVPEQPAPQQQAPVVNVTVPVPTVRVESATPSVNVLPQKPSAYEVRITERDASGFIKAFVILPRENF